jgi:hypothetical protein
MIVKNLFIGGLLGLSVILVTTLWIGMWNRAVVIKRL